MAAALTVALAHPLPLNALQTLEISGNGSESESVVSVHESQNTTISQTNETEAETKMEIAADSGNNSISDSSGSEQYIETGEVTVSETVDNSLNHSAVEHEDCCVAPTEVVVKNNGTGSTNTVEVSRSTPTTVNTSQQATVRNSVSSKTNTGNNQVTGGSGTSIVKTGNVTETVTFSNQLNQTIVKTSTGNSRQVSVKVKGNGRSSTNSVSLTHDDSVIIWINNASAIDNEVEIVSETGGNSVLDNLGDILIQTGTIDTSVAVDTVANVSVVDFEDCCQQGESPPDDSDKPGDDEEKPPENDKKPPKEDEPQNQSPPPSTPPNNPPPAESKSAGSGGNGGPDSGRGGVMNDYGRVLGASDFQVLPATASRDFLLMLMANIFTFMLGCYLRLHSGRAPAFAS